MARIKNTTITSATKKGMKPRINSKKKTTTKKKTTKKTTKKKTTTKKTTKKKTTTKKTGVKSRISSRSKTTTKRITPIKSTKKKSTKKKSTTLRRYNYIRKYTNRAQKRLGYSNQTRKRQRKVYLHGRRTALLRYSRHKYRRAKNTLQKMNTKLLGYITKKRAVKSQKQKQLLTRYTTNLRKRIARQSTTVQKNKRLLQKRRTAYNKGLKKNYFQRIYTKKKTKSKSKSATKSKTKSRAKSRLKKYQTRKRNVKRNGKTITKTFKKPVRIVKRAPKK